MKRSKEKIVSLGIAGLVSLFLSGCFNSGPTPFETTLAQNEEVAGLGSATGTVELNFEAGEMHINVTGLPALGGTFLLRPNIKSFLRGWWSALSRPKLN